MSGFKRRTPYRKNVEKEVLEALPEPEEGQHIVEVVQSHGSNIFLVTMQDGGQTLARLPTRFRNLIWVKRGTFLLCSSSDAEYLTASGAAGRVTLNVEYVLFERQVKHLKALKKWPEAWMGAFSGSNEYGAGGAAARDGTAGAGEAAGPARPAGEVAAAAAAAAAAAETEAGAEAATAAVMQRGETGKNTDESLRRVEDNDIFVNKNHQNRAGDESSGTDLSSDEDDD
jgi:translation initiation factor IF-1